jgi:hypothetical protein
VNSAYHWLPLNKLEKIHTENVREKSAMKEKEIRKRDENFLINFYRISHIVYDSMGDSRVCIYT